MKKLVLMFVAIAAMSFASCGETKAPEAPAVEENVEEVAENDTLAADTAAVEAGEEVVEEAEA